MELTYGNLLEKAKAGEFDVIIQGCNCFHTMGAGIAKYIKQDFPEAFAADKATAYGDKNKLGTFSEATITRNGHTFVVINAYTQFRYGGGVDNFDYASFPSLLRSIKAKYGDKRIGLPLIGCGLAGGNEPRILSMIDENFDGVAYSLVEIDTNRKLDLGEIKNIEQQLANNREEIAFTKVASPFGWLGNMAPYPVEYEGVKYLTTEALFQSLRFNGHPDIQKEIIEQKSPMSAKVVANKFKHVIEEEGYELLGQKDIDNMKLCIKLKLEQHPELKQQLVETNNKAIIEDCSSCPQGSGLFWGAQKTNEGWKGQNILGEVWMEYRTQLQNNQELTTNKVEEVVKQVKPKEYTFFFHLTSPFSNFHPSKFVYKDLTFVSNEQFMMYSKAKTFKDEVTAQKIIDMNKQPLIKDFIEGKYSREDIVKDKYLADQWNKLMMKTKSFGREVKNYDDQVWTNRRAKVVLFGAREKFSQNEDLKQILLATGDTYLVEASPYDNLSTMNKVIQKLKTEFITIESVNKPQKTHQM